MEKPEFFATTAAAMVATSTLDECGPLRCGGCMRNHFRMVEYNYEMRQHPTTVQAMTISTFVSGVLSKMATPSVGKDYSFVGKVSVHLFW